MGTLLKDYKASGVRVKDDERAIIATISTDAVDRDNEVIIPKGIDLKAYRKNPVVMWAHNYAIPPIAKATEMDTGKERLVAKAVFAETELAEEVFQLYKGGFLNMFSIGFLPKENHEPTEKDLREHPEWAPVRRVHDKTEMLEFSCVPIGSNRDALREAVSTGSLTLSPVMQKAVGLDPEEPQGEKSDIEIIGDIIPLDAVFKPYPEEHSCRLKDPGGYDRFARKNCEQKHEDKCIDVIYGIKSGKSEVQALRYKKDIWTPAAARSHCSSREGTFEAAKSLELERQREAEHKAKLFILDSMNKIAKHEKQKQEALDRALGRP
jgi:phage head maturation protease